MEMSKGKKENGCGIIDLEGTVNAARTSRVYVLSEVGYDTAYFNNAAYSNLLSLMESDKDEISWGKK